MMPIREKGLRTPLKRVRGLGPAKEGVSHWWQMRLTSLALVPLVLWFVFSALRLEHSDYTGTRIWVANPLHAVPLILLTCIMFLHAASGMQVVLEDYVHHEGRKLAFIYAVKGTCLVLAAASVFAILKIAFGTTA
jgi:succinate dehydrogenase / fumarate reductase membrane anchor subunit